MVLTQSDLDFHYVKSNYSYSGNTPSTPGTYDDIFGATRYASSNPELAGGPDGLSQIHAYLSPNFLTGSGTFCRKYDYASFNDAVSHTHLVVATVKDIVDGGAWDSFDTNAYSIRAYLRIDTTDQTIPQGTMIGICAYSENTLTMPGSLYLKVEDTPTQPGVSTPIPANQANIKIVGCSYEYGEIFLGTADWSQWYRLRLDVIPAGDGFYHIVWYSGVGPLDSETWTLLGTSLTNTIPQGIGYFHCSIQGQGAYGSGQLVCPASYIDSVTFLSENIAI